MEDESIRLPDSPDVSRSWRKISTGKLSLLYSEEKLLPNYLRSPTGSCHDVCKYGRKHDSEDKPRVKRTFSGSQSLDSPLRKKVLTKSMLNSNSHTKTKVRNLCSRGCETRLADSTKPKKKMVSQSFNGGNAFAKEMVLHHKRVTALKLQSVAQTAAIALRRSTVNRNKINGSSKAAEPKKPAVSFKASTRYSKTKKESSSSNVPSRKTRKEVDLAEEKTLYVIKMKTGNEIVESDQNQRCVMDSPTDVPNIEMSQNEVKCIATGSHDDSSQEEDENVSLSEHKNITRQGKSKALSTESKSMKLRFKRGKILDFGSSDNGPRKLKFKRGKIITGGADSTSKSSGRKSLKTKGSNFISDKGQQHKHKSLKVVLKHQETQKKKDSRGLYNNVIEETANKLAETRKSKVKALVGAFESVISLHERSSSAVT